MTFNEWSKKHTYEHFRNGNNPFSKGFVENWKELYVFGCIVVNSSSSHTQCISYRMSQSSPWFDTYTIDEYRQKYYPRSVV